MKGATRRGCELPAWRASPTLGRAAATALLGLLVAASSAAAGEVPTEKVEGGRYVLLCQSDRAEAIAMSRVLEACWAPFKEFFGDEPKLKGGERLPVKFYATQEAWAAGIAADGATAPGAGGYYHPSNRTVYFFRQPTRYYTRCLMIHEACHQFHFLARTGNTGPLAGWYVEGVVEHLALHHWDGERLTLGASALSLEDYPAAALGTLEKGECDLPSLVDGKGNRPLGAMFVRFLLEAEKGRFRRAFFDMAARYDRGQPSTSCFRSSFGDPRALQPRFHEWLKEAQCPLTPVFNEWEQTGESAFKGLAIGVTSVCRLKAGASRLEAAVAIPGAGPWRGGLLVHFSDPTDFTTAMVDDQGVLAVSRLRKGIWTPLLRRARPPSKAPGLARLAAERLGGSVTVFAEGESVGAFELPGAFLGLALHDCELGFRELRWELAPRE